MSAEVVVGRRPPTLRNRSSGGCRSGVADTSIDFVVLSSGRGDVGRYCHRLGWVVATGGKSGSGGYASMTTGVRIEPSTRERIHCHGHCSQIVRIVRRLLVLERVWGGVVRHSGTGRATPPSVPLTSITAEKGRKLRVSGEVPRSSSTRSSRASGRLD